MKRGFQLLDPMLHCSSCKELFTDEEIEAYNLECNLAEDAPVALPEICSECAEVEVLDTKLLRACGGPLCLEADHGIF